MPPTATSAGSVSGGPDGQPLPAVRRISHSRSPTGTMAAAVGALPGLAPDSQRRAIGRRRGSGADALAEAEVASWLRSVTAMHRPSRYDAAKTSLKIVPASSEMPARPTKAARRWSTLPTGAPRRYTGARITRPMSPLLAWTNWNGAVSEMRPESRAARKDSRFTGWLRASRPKARRLASKGSMNSITKCSLPPVAGWMSKSG